MSTIRIGVWLLFAWSVTAMSCSAAEQCAEQLSVHQELETLSKQLTSKTTQAAVKTVIGWSHDDPTYDQRKEIIRLLTDLKATRCLAAVLCSRTFIYLERDRLLKQVPALFTVQDLPALYAAMCTVTWSPKEEANTHSSGEPRLGGDWEWANDIAEAASSVLGVKHCKLTSPFTERDLRGDLADWKEGTALPIDAYAGLGREELNRRAAMAVWKWWMTALKRAESEQAPMQKLKHVTEQLQKARPPEPKPDSRKRDAPRPADRRDREETKEKTHEGKDLFK